MNNDSQFLNFNAIKNLARWWKNNNYCNKVEIAALEPFLYKNNEHDIIDVINLLQNFKFKLSITTNGILLKNFIDRLDKNSLDLIRVSWHSMDKSIYRYITSNGNYDEFIYSIISAINKQLPISINRVILKNYTLDIGEHINFIDKYKLRLKLLDLYYTEEIKDIYDKFYISPEEVLREFIENKTIIFDKNISAGRNRIIYKTKNNGIIEYKDKKTANKNNAECKDCKDKLNCLEGYADYFRVFPNKKGTFCYMRPDLDFIVFDENNEVILQNSDIYKNTPLRLCVVGICNFNCGFPKENISWCLKRNRNFIFPKRN